MNKLFAITTAIALMVGTAYAQNTGAPANAQTDSSKSGMSNPSTSGTASTTPSPRGDASTSGAGTAAGPNNSGSSAEPGNVQKGQNKQ